MTEKIVLQFEKPVQIFTINGMDYKVYYDDAAIEKYKDILLKFSNEYDRIKAVNVDALSVDESKVLKAEQGKLVEGLIESIFGEDSYETIYVSTGKSLLNLLDIVEAFSMWLEKKFSKYKQGKQDYYTPARAKK